MPLAMKIEKPETSSQSAKLVLTNITGWIYATVSMIFIVVAWVVVIKKKREWFLVPAT